MRFCLMIEGQESVTWDHWLAPACTAERSRFEALFRSEHSFSLDHYVSARGVGAGWWTEEHTQFGPSFPPTRERFKMLELLATQVFPKVED